MYDLLDIMIPTIPFQLFFIKKFVNDITLSLPLAFSSPDSRLTR